MPIDEKTYADSFAQIQMGTRDAVHFDVPYFDGVIDGQGLVFQHLRALPCPIGKTDPMDVRHTHADHSGCSNGYIYELAGEMTCIISGGSKRVQALDMGLLTGATLQITVPRFYTDDPKKEVIVAFADRLYLKDNKAKVVATQLFEHNTGGLDRVRRSILEVEHLIDSHGKRYREHEDFRVAGGQIAWTGTRQPGMDPTTNKGEVCSIRYRYTPYWYISHILHEIRVVREGLDSARAPQAALIQREYIFEDEQNDPLAPSSLRQAPAPRQGSFGVR